MTASSLFHGIISGNRRRSHDEVAERADRIASRPAALGVTQGDSVCMLMRNDIAFIEAAYAAMRLGAYGVPINWHFKPEEINYMLKDSGTRVLIAHADMLHGLRDAIPDRRHRARVPTPPEILAQLQDRSRSSRHRRTSRIDFESWLQAVPALRRPGGAAAAEHDLHLGHHGPSQGRAPQRADAGADGQRRAHARADLRPQARCPRHPARPALSLRAELALACAPAGSAACWC